MTLQNDTVIEDIIIPPPSQKYLRRGYRAISETPDGKKYLMICTKLYLFCRGGTIAA